MRPAFSRLPAVAAACALAACGNVDPADDHCHAGTVDCYGSCANLDEDPLHCGSCDTECQGAPNASPACEAGDCAIECNPGFWDLSGGILDGCEYECTFTSGTDSCNGLDDDCNGLVDDFAAGSCHQSAEVDCTTTCGSTGRGMCDEFCNPPTPSECTPPAEICNGVDDDCVNGADDGFPCVAGAETGCTTTCGSEGTGTCLDTCAIPPPGACTPPSEACNGVDDDCVGGADDAYACVRGAEVACTTSCGSTGTGTCTDACEVPAAAACDVPAEACNWKDDDCDSDVDEGGWGESMLDARLAGEATWAHGPVLAFGASTYLVAWAEVAASDTDHGLYLRALDTAGGTVGGEEAAVGPDPMLYPGDVAWSGSEFVVGFADNRYGNLDAWGVRVAANGTSLSVEADVSGAENAETSVRVAWTGSDWGFSWMDSRSSNRVYLSGVNDGSLIRDFEDPITGGLGYIYGDHDIAWTGSSYGVCWGDNRDGTYQLYFKVVSPLGVDLIPDQDVTTDFDGVHACSIGWTGSEFAIGWAGEKAATARAAYVVTIDPAGLRLTSDVFLGAVASSSPTQPVQVVVAPALGIGVGWSRFATTQQIVFTRFGFDLDRMGDNVVVSDGDGPNVAPSMAWDGSGFGLAWESGSGPSSGDVVFSRVGCL